MIDQSLRELVKAQLAQGLAHETARKSLVMQGFSEADVDELLASLPGRQTSAAVPAAPLAPKAQSSPVTARPPEFQPAPVPLGARFQPASLAPPSVLTTPVPVSSDPLPAAPHSARATSGAAAAFHAPAVAAASAPTAPPRVPPPAPPHKPGTIVLPLAKPHVRRLIPMIGGALAAALLAGGAYAAYRYWAVSSDSLVKSDLSEPVESVTSQDVSSLVEPEATTSAEIVPPAPPVGGPGDADNDDLIDSREILYGTDPNNPDTDGDGYLDGDEVTNGYNPLGPGRL